MDVDEGVDEQTAPQIGGIASDLAALIIEGACDGVVVEIGVDEAAEGPEDQDIVLRQKPVPRSMPDWKSMVSRSRLRLYW
jgi:hypothetical protein